MSKKNDFMSEEELKQVRRMMQNVKGSRALHPNASAVEKTKYKLCQEFVKYLRVKEISQRELAKRLKVSESRVSEITHYYIDKITIDKLVELHERLNHTVTFKIA